MFERPGVNPAIMLAHGAFADASRYLRPAAHNLPREAPQALARAVIDVNGC
jgi:hypothetical protein